MNEGDWICDSQCGNMNFARRTSCNRCGKSMSSTEELSIPQRKKLGHEIGKAAAEKSRGLFSADDWQCGRCGNVNWARRQQCNMCNAPKFGEVEERTGLGGGYNERENVEYIERDESDGEYDDFGRKKKKFRGNESPTKSEPKKEPPTSVKTPKTNDEEEEDDEDEDDDGDLSKYDLTDWGDETSKNDEERRSLSRSSESRSSSYSSQSSPSSSDSEKQDSTKRTHSRSRSSSVERNLKRKRSKSPDHIRSATSRFRDRSESSSPSSSKR